VTNVNDAPTVAITAPTDGATFTEGADITINATASDTDGTVSSVAFYRDLALIGTDTSSPYSLTWPNAAVGSYALTAVATDDGSLQTTSSVVNVTVNLPNYSTTYQAEDASYGGGSVFETKNAGWHGTGYINFSSSGGYVEFSNVDGGAGGDVTLEIRYALGNSTRTGLLIVNGVSQSITFPSLGSDWTVWSTNELTVSLGSSSTNTLRFESNGQDLANIDEIIVTTAAAVPDRPTLVATAQDNSIVLSWETNAVDFVLEYTTNDFPTTNWMSASPVPVTVDESHFVTNALDGDKRFYRLHKP
jgi:hypothetical protein